MTSHAQNAEDVRLWRVLATRSCGFYVDVGAGHPVYNSVTKLFYDNGWSGLNVEPGPEFVRLVAARPRDTTLDVAISASSSLTQTPGTSRHNELSPIGGSSHELLPEAIPLPTTLRTARLDELVAKHAPGRQIDFLRIDVDGAECDTLGSFDPRVVRPTVVLVEAISPVADHPTHQEWEHLLLEGDYRFAGFDGINRFYVPDECADLVPALGYPVGPLDRYTTTANARTQRSVDADPLSPSSGVTIDELRQLRDAVGRSNDAVATLQRTVSWRVTRPLRAIRRVQLRASRALSEGVAPDLEETARFESAFAARLRQAADLLADHPSARRATGGASVKAALCDVRVALESPATDARAAAWLLMAVVDGSYPSERATEYATQILRGSGPEAFTRLLEGRFATAIEDGMASTAELDVVTDEVVVDVTQIAVSDLHTGIQRVARECVSRWLRAGRPLRLAYFDDDFRALRLLGDEEVTRLQRWQDFLDDAGEFGTRNPVASDNILIPWKCDLVLAELPTPERSTALRGLVVSRTHRSLCLVCFDLIPIVAPESVDPRIVGTFADYLALLKHADRVSAISQQSANDVRAYASMLDGQGLRSPEIVEHALPTEAPTRPHGASRPASDPRDQRESLVLVVGVHVPRKNHAAVLEAAERLWRSGHRFELVFMGGSMWRAEGHFHAFVERLQAAGLPVRVETKVSEARLWEAYRSARFTVFPSLIEGFGLPVAESLAAGTPVITSNYGSMAEIAEGGGALTVDPRNVDDLEEQMRRLLEDDPLLDRLRAEARRRDMGTWSDYADALWSFFFRGLRERRD